ncbi:MAG: hypothetical protein KF723_03285 [Rhizobiaceae bacterium]|nr:hypothetical protein [Rhizobiaceae bacterium]
MTQISKTPSAKSIATKAGYEVVEGAYIGTSEDCAGRWYVQHESDEVVDRRGQGFATKKAAWEAAAFQATYKYAEAA